VANSQIKRERQTKREGGREAEGEEERKRGCSVTHLDPVISAEW
jgi:hypothetical protein